MDNSKFIKDCWDKKCPHFCIFGVSDNNCDFCNLLKGQQICEIHCPLDNEQNKNVIYREDS